MTDHNIGEMLSGGYRVIDIKAGGMGVVYICHQPSTGRMYAIKTVRVDPGIDSEEFLARFRDEVNNWIRISGEAHHKNIVDALLYNEDERWLFLQYIDGPALYELTHQHLPHLKHAFSWALDIAQGMVELHERFSLLHRDLKPRNVLVDQGLTAKITDLGIGKVLQENRVAETMVGTPGYMAPETMLGGTDFRSDIYSFGAVFYRMVAGVEPYGRGLPTEQGTLLPASSKCARISAPVDAFLARCLHPSPSGRFQSFREVVAALAEAKAKTDFEYTDGYRFCAKHSYYSPVGEKFPDCIFCEQQRKKLALLSRAEELQDQLKARIPEATLALPDAKRPASYGTPPRERGAVTAMATLTEKAGARAGAPAHTLTESAARMEAIRAAPPAKRTKLYAGIGAVALLLFGISGFLLFGGKDQPEKERDSGEHKMQPVKLENPEKKSAIDPAVDSASKSATPTTCIFEAENGTVCGQPAASGTFRSYDKKQSRFTGQELPQQYCKEHSSYYCSECKRQNPSEDMECPNCEKKRGFRRTEKE